ncbi:DUF4232 domain-containing protein [Streptomyces sp. R44]|uniref:DUF4232 domain-containing protein n=1 Tax=Streptomyces sp. R44 TaxID=3238633 RepID=A0AB39T406_9ACTN
MRAARKTWKTYTLGAVAVAALLSSTACGPSGGTEDGAASQAPSAAPSATASATGSTPSEAPSPTGSAKPSATATAEPGGDSKDKAPACADPDVSIDTSYWPHDSGQHLLITATNDTDRACTLYFYPFIYFGQETENPLPPMESPAKAVATIGPKQKAYAGVKLFLGGEKTETYESFGIAYRDPSNNNDSAPIDVAFSKDVQFVTVGRKPSVTFWNLDRSEVERFVFKAR